MKKNFIPLSMLLIFFIPLLLQGQSIKSQATKRDEMNTYNSTDWVSMMRNRNVNIHEVQKAFYKWYKKNQHIDKDKKVEGKTEDEAYEAFKRWEWYNLPRADVNGTRADPYKVASDYADYLSHGSSHGLSHGPLTPSVTASWTYAGNTTVPSNSSTGNGGDGRVNRVRLMPGNTSTMFACAPSGGLWKTTNGGASWSENTDQLGDLSTSDIAINPLKTNIMYLATGDGDGIQSIYPTPATIGILKSYDGGNTWNATTLAYSLSVAGADYYSVNEILIDPADTSVVLAATTFGIWRSANSGATWTLCTGTGTGSATWFHSMEFEPSHPSIVYAATSNVISGIGANFYRSTNNGISWTRITSGLPSSTTAEGFEIGVSAADSNDVYVLACNSTNYGYLGLYFSTNDGVSFSTQSTSPDLLGWEANGANDGGQGWYTLSMAVSQTNIDSVWVGGVNIWASSNGGTSWHLNSNWEGTPYVHADIHHIQFIPGTNSKGYVVGCDGGVFMTSNSGTSWTDLSHNLEIAQQYCVGPSATTAGAWITGWQDNGTNFSTTPWSQVYGGDGMYCFVDWSNNNNYFAETAEGAFVKSTNAGGTWANANGGITETGPWVTLWMQDPRTSTTLYSGFDNVWKSTNSGGTWTKISTWGGTGLISGLAVDSANVSYIYAAQPNLIELTTNGGTSWTNITGTLPVSSTSISAIAVSAKTPSHVWVTFAGYSSGNEVFASTNSGSTWTNISTGLPNLPVNCIASESGSPNGIYVGTDQGVYYHDTVINSWVFYNTGLPLVMIGDLKIYKPGRELIAATYGRGTWETPLYSNPSSCTLSVTATSISYPSCFGSANGSISATPSGGTSPYTYSWTGGNSNSTATSLSAGTYTITIRDVNGCSATASTILTQPATAVGISLSSTSNINCNATTGAITAGSATGGISPYTYSWAPLGGSNLIASNLSAGVYTITATDNHGCSSSASATITQSTPLSVVASTTANSSNCAGNGSGIVSAAPSGGTSPYSYSWTGGSATSTESNLSAGTYTITVTDKNNCSATASATVTQPALLGVSVSILSSISCLGGIGSISANASGGIIPYTYSWTGGSSNSTLSGISAGTYTITLKDNSGCSVSASTILTQPATAIGISISSTSNINCNATTGAITAGSATGGISPYTYSWAPLGGSNLIASNLSAGIYTITATDNHGCSSSASATITQSTPLSVVESTTANSSNCAGNGSGSVSAAPSGGTSPYTYSWTGGSTNSTESNLSAGTYTITVTDKNNCSATASATVTQPALLGVSVSILSSISCLGSIGSISANASGGIIPYTYSWTGGSSNSTLSGISAGTYTITLKDNSGCSVSASTILTQPATAVGISISSTSSFNCSGSLGSATANSATGGTPPYTYAWTPGGATTLVASNLSSGTYTITATDNHGCSASVSATITQSAVLSVSAGTTTNNSSCSGGNGSVFSTPSGGTSPYTYSWTGGSTNSSLSGLAAGTYTITLSDNHGCTVTASATVTQTSSGLAITKSNITNISCYGGNGSATANAATGGSLPYTYSWSPGGGTNLNTIPIGAGTYTITVTDNNGCTASISMAITQPSSPVGITLATISNVLCYGGNGSITANTATGGTSPYTYLWSPSGGTNLAASVTAGVYSITVTDNHGCTSILNATVTQPTQLSASASVSNNVNCNGGTNGSVVASSSGGSSPYTYSWAGGSTLSSESGLSAGTYSVLLTDKNGCTVTASATITQSSSLSVSASTTANINCNSGNTGSVSASPSGGNLPYTYSWSGGSTSSAETGLSAGTYTITLADNNGCTATASTMVTQSPGISVSANTTSNVSCNGGNNGSVSASLSGGTSPYTYSWNNGGASSSLSGLSAGTYSIIITDKNGCTASSSTIITQTTSGLGITKSSVTNVLCYGGNGYATANAATGGSAPYTYSWSPGGGTNLTTIPIGAGIYTITVIDNNGCTATTSATITQPAILSASLSSISNINCDGGTTTASANTPTGGIPPYTYSWSPAGGTNQSATVSAGTYTLVVSDNNGCTNLLIATITQPQALGLSISSESNITCYGSTGNITANAATGGTLPYTYSWSPSGGTALITNPVSAGIYTITAEDNRGCTYTVSATLTQPASVLGITISSISNVSCYGGIGSITVNTANGGTSPYTYSWSPSGGSTQIASGSSGSYTLTIFDNAGCSSTLAATITQPTSLSVSVTINSAVSCSGANTGSISANATGGTLPYTYSWSAGSTKSSVTGLSSGTYTITLIDLNGCVATNTVVLSQPVAINSSASILSNVLCHGAASGTAQVVVSGGSAPYTYSWNPGGGTNSSASSLSAGTYSIAVADNNGCGSTSTLTITQPAAIRDSVAGISYPACSMASATIGVKGGLQPYTFSWSPVTNSTSIATGLTKGTYSVTIKDANGCTATIAVTITQTNGITASVIISSYVTCSGGANGLAKVGAGGGTSPYTYSWSPNTSSTYIANALTAGTYTVTITDKNGCTTTAAATITQPPALKDSVSRITYPNCTVSTGSVTIGVKGGISPYTYTWNPVVSTTATATGLTIRSYTVTVKDASACTSTVSFSISQPPSLRDSIINSLTVNVTCGLNTNGSATVGVKYGTPPYTYSWNPSSGTTATLSGLSVGTYSVTVKDANSCSATASATITQIPGVIPAIVITSNVSCNGGTNGQAKAGVSGGVSPYTYSWSPNTSSTYLANSLSAGVYSVKVTDKNGCNGIATVTITQPAALRDSMVIITDPTCYNGTGSATYGVKGGVSPYTYIWNPSVSTTATGTGLSARSYIVEVKDADGCTAEVTFSITQPVNIRDSIIKASTLNILCNGSSSGSASVGVKNGTSPYTYSWNPSSNRTATSTGLSAGVYTVTVTDRCANSATATVTITQPNELRDSISSSTCTSNLITATVGAKGGLSPYTYSWSPGGGTKATMTGLSAGTFTITLTDKNGCFITFNPVLSCGATVLSPDYNSGSLCCQGIEETIKLYPNPNTGQFTIDIPGFSNNSVIEVYNMLGLKVKSEILQMQSSMIDLTSQPSGIYFYRIINAVSGDLTGSGKIVIQK